MSSTTAAPLRVHPARAELDPSGSPGSTFLRRPGAPEEIATLSGILQQSLGDRFEVLAPLAVGGRTAVFQLRHRLHGGLFAAKVLYPEIAVEAGSDEAFRTEAMHAARLGDHPNAVPVFDYDDRGVAPFLLMPFVPGADLDGLLAQHGPMPVDEVLELGAQMAGLLAYAETEGVVHCDLSPGNLRLDRFSRYRLLDFGSSHLRTQPLRAGRCGNLLYTAPEQHCGAALDGRADLYSLGAVLAEAASGEPLFAAATPGEVRQRHLTGDWQLPAAVNEGDPLAGILSKLLALGAEDRMHSAYELSGILDGLGFPRPEFRAAPFLYLQGGGGPM